MSSLLNKLKTILSVRKSCSLKMVWTTTKLHFRVKCKVCTKIFSKNDKLEAHIKSEHKEIEKFSAKNKIWLMCLNGVLKKKMHKENHFRAGQCFWTLIFLIFARWSHEVAIFLEGIIHPSIHPTDHTDFFCQCCAVSPP